MTIDENYPLDNAPVDEVSLLRFDPDVLADVQQHLLTLQLPHIRSFVGMRKDGAANDMATTIYGARLTVWHTEAGRNQDEPTKLHYETGLLFGTEVTKRQAYLSGLDPLLTVSSIAAYDVAVKAVKGSYDHPMLAENQTVENPWRVEHIRERLFVDTSSSLSLLNATLDSYITAQLRQLYTEQGMCANHIEESQRVAFLRGMIDGAIFSNSYVRAIYNGSGPEDYTDDVEQLLKQEQSYKWRLYNRLRLRKSLGSFSLSSSADIEELLDDRSDVGARVQVKTIDKARGLRFLTIMKDAKQTGPNTFDQYWRIEKDQNIAEASVPEDVPDLMRRGLFDIMITGMNVQSVLAISAGALSFAHVNLTEINEHLTYENYYFVGAGGGAGYALFRAVLLARDRIKSKKDNGGEAN